MTLLPGRSGGSDSARNEQHRAKGVIDELRLYVRGWLNYYKISNTFSEVKDLSQ